MHFSLLFKYVLLFLNVFFYRLFYFYFIITAHTDLIKKKSAVFILYCFKHVLTLVNKQHFPSD